MLLQLSARLEIFLWLHIFILSLTDTLENICYLFIQMIKSWGWKDGSAVKGASCSCKGPKFHFHHPCQVPITATPKDPAPYSGCQEDLHSCAYASKQTCINIHTLF